MQSYFMSVEKTPSFTGSTLPFCCAKYLPESDPTILFSRCFIILASTCTSLETGYNVEWWLHVSLDTHLSDDPPRAQCTESSAQMHLLVKSSHKKQNYTLEHIHSFSLPRQTNPPTLLQEPVFPIPSTQATSPHIIWFIFLAQETGLNKFLDVTVI